MYLQSFAVAWLLPASLGGKASYVEQTGDVQGHLKNGNTEIVHLGCYAAPDDAITTEPSGLSGANVMEDEHDDYNQLTDEVQPVAFFGPAVFDEVLTPQSCGEHCHDEDHDYFVVADGTECLCVNKLDPANPCMDDVEKQFKSSNRVLDCTQERFCDKVCDEISLDPRGGQSYIDVYCFIAEPPTSSKAGMVPPSSAFESSSVRMVSVQELETASASGSATATVFFDDDEQGSGSATGTATATVFFDDDEQGSGSATGTATATVYIGDD